MPNWCATRLAVTGRRNELESLRDAINSMPSAASPRTDDFGPWWLGKLVNILGGDWERTDCRGVLSPDPCEEPCWNCQEPDPDGRVKVESKRVLRFSLVTAWNTPYGLLDLIRTRFPSLRFHYKATDEFGNFHTVHDPGNVIDNIAYETEGADNWREFTRSQRKEFCQHLGRITGLDFRAGMSDRTIEKRFEDWAAALEEDDERQYISVIIWKERRKPRKKAASAA